MPHTNKDIYEKLSEIAVQQTETQTMVKMVLPDIEQNKKDIKSLNKAKWVVGGMGFTSLGAAAKALWTATFGG